ncbi:MAG TPA: ABC transporter permease subunit [Micromonosporaceae bacterium]|nr:ABC transporter permease subunit [Micromonosporaceae bacterium]
MNPTIAMITMRGLLGRRRFLLLFPLPLLLVGAAALARSTGVPPTEWAGHVLVGLGIAVVLPLIALVVGTGVLGSEIDDGTLTHVLAKPLPRWQIVLTKLAVAVAVVTTVTATAGFLAGLLAGSGRLAVGMAVGCLVGAMAYSALFLALSVVSRRPVLLGLLYVLIWEGLLGNLLAGTRSLSIQQYVVTVVGKVAGTDLLGGTVSLRVSLIMAAIFAVAATALAIDRLRSFTVAGETG